MGAAQKQAERQAGERGLAQARANFSSAARCAPGVASQESAHLRLNTTSGLLHDLPRSFVVAQAEKPDVTKAVRDCPLQNCKLSNNFRAYPDAFTHTFSVQALAPAAIVCLGKIEKRASFVDERP